MPARLGEGLDAPIGNADARFEEKRTSVEAISIATRLRTYVERVRVFTTGQAHLETRKSMLDPVHDLWHLSKRIRNLKTLQLGDDASEILRASQGRSKSKGSAHMVALHVDELELGIERTHSCWRIALLREDDVR